MAENASNEKNAPHQVLKLFLPSTTIEGETP